VGALVSLIPLEAEIPLGPLGGIGGDDRDEQGAVANLPPYLLVPGIAAAQLALVEPNFDARGLQRIADATCGRSILRGIAQENSSILLRLGPAPRLIRNLPDTAHGA
jgi:hypothetical protein